MECITLLNKLIDYLYNGKNNMYMYIYTYICVCMYMYIYTYICVCVYIYISEEYFSYKE